MEILVVIISWLLFGGASSYLAIQRGRDPFAWFLIGMLLGILGLGLLYLLPPLNKESVEDEEKPPREYEWTASNEKEVVYRLKAWYYLDEESRQVGPLTFNELKKINREGKLTQSTWLWSEGMEEWKPLKELPDIQEVL